MCESKAHKKIGSISRTHVHNNLTRPTICDIGLCYWLCSLEKASSLKMAWKYCENNRAMYWSLASFAGHRPSMNPMWPPLAVITIATCSDLLASSTGIAAKFNYDYMIYYVCRINDLPSNGWNGSSAALRHKTGTLIMCSLLWRVAAL